MKSGYGSPFVLGDEEQGRAFCGKRVDGWAQGYTWLNPVATKKGAWQPTGKAGVGTLQGSFTV